MMLTESINQDHMSQETIAVGQPRQTDVAGVQEGWMPSGPPQASGAWLAAGLHNRRVVAIHRHHRHLLAAWPSATAFRQVRAIGSLRKLWRGMLAVWGRRPLPEPDRYAPWAKVSPSSAHEHSTPPYRPAVCGVPGPGRRYVEGGQAYVLEVPGSVYSQAPPISHADGADQQDCDLRTAM